MASVKKDTGEQLGRLRRICSALPETEERLSHGEPTFFAAKKVFAMFSNNHHKDGHIAVWLPAPAGLQEALIAEAPETYYRPPYVGGKGWIGIELSAIDDDGLRAHIHEAWRMIAPKRLHPPAEPRL
jgi:hypothetical protein